jgi:hypothetical protein
MKLKTLSTLFLLAIPVILFAQTGKILKDAGLKKLNVFVGTWKSVNTSAGGPAISAISTIAWSANGLYLIADQIVTIGDKKTNNLSIYSYNQEHDVYKLSLVGVPGMAPFSIPVSYKSDMLIYSSDYTDGSGKKMYNRTLNTFISPTLYTYQVQSSTDSINWTTSMEGRTVKVDQKN